MKSLTKLTALAAAVFTCGFAAFAGPKDGAAPPSPPSGDHAGGPAGPGSHGGPIALPGIRVPKNIVIPDALQKSIDQYNALRQAETTIQKALIAKLTGATDADKQAVKDQLKANRDKFLEDTKQLRADIREQIKALRAALGDTPPVDGGDKGGKGKGRKGG